MKGNSKRQSLTESEENALVSWISRISLTGYPYYSTVHEMTEEIRKRRLTDINDISITLIEYPPLGQQWVRRFLQRHSHLTLTFTHCIDTVRFKESSEEVLLHWLNTVNNFVMLNNIRPENVYNMDEWLCNRLHSSSWRHCRFFYFLALSSSTRKAGMGIGFGVHLCRWWGHSAHGYLQRYFISILSLMKGTNLLTGWIPYQQATEGWCFSYSNKGWTTNAHGLQWLHRCFEPTTREKAGDKARVVISEPQIEYLTSETSI